MKLDRNIESNEGMGKYALLKLRQLELCREDGPFAGYTPRIAEALKVLEENGILDKGIVGSESEFFVIRLKDKYALPALKAYADAAEEDDFEWASEVREMARRSGGYSKFCKTPDYPPPLFAHPPQPQSHRRGQICRFNVRFVRKVQRKAYQSTARMRRA